MKLSELINYRNELLKLDFDPMVKTVEGDLQKVLYLAGNQPMVIENYLQRFADDKKNIDQSIDNFRNSLRGFIDELNQIIAEVEQPYFSDSYRLYENEISNETQADIKNRVPNLPSSTVDFYKSRISRYIGWQHATMILRPGFEPYVNEMVACDPVYLVDIKHELLEPAVSQFNEVYQKRLRTYVVNENSTEKMLGRLPDSQFGVILAYNYFSFRPLEIIKKWLVEFLEKLKPGGVLILSFNDCDRDKAVMLVERRFCCYTPGNMLKELAQSLGYEILFQWHDDGPSTWLELKKPGTLSTIRGGQTLAKIMPK
jgi:SAM-dependent methyltransferase